MYRNLSIIKIALVFLGLSGVGYTCSPALVITSVGGQMEVIDKAHQALETSVETYYNTNIKPLLVEIDALQVDIAKVMVHMRTLEKEANKDEKKLLFLLNKNQKLREKIEDHGS